MSKAQVAVAGSDEATSEVEKLENGGRMVRSQIKSKSSMDAAWKVITTFEKFPDHFENMVSSEVVEKQGTRTRVCQSGQRNLPMGIKLKNKVVLEYDEKEVETLPTGKKRVLEFKCVEGEFHVYEGYWSVETSDSDKSTVITYCLSMKPKTKIPVPMALLESSMKEDTKKSLARVRDAAMAV